MQLADINKIMVNVSIEENEDNEFYVGEEPVEENNTVNSHGPMASANILELANHDRERIEEVKSRIKKDLDAKLHGFRKKDRALLRQHVQNVNRVMGNIVIDNITATNNLVWACAILVGVKLGLKASRETIETKEPWWKRRIN